VYGRLSVNVALNRPTFASSVLSGGPYDPYPSSNAVDGNRDTDADKADHSCFSSEGQTNPWMAVDLGAALAVAGVLFTNRGNYGIKVYSLCRCRYETWAQQRCQYTQS